MEMNCCTCSHLIGYCQISHKMNRTREWLTFWQPCGQTLHKQGKCQMSGWHFTYYKQYFKLFNVIILICHYRKPTDQISNLVPVAWDTVTQQAGSYLEIGEHLHRKTNLLPLPVRLWCSVFQWAYNTNWSAMQYEIKSSTHLYNTDLNTTCNLEFRFCKCFL
jgi:hypothetical protein